MRRGKSPQRLGVNRIHHYLKTLLNYFNNILKLSRSFNDFQFMIKIFQSHCPNCLWCRVTTLVKDLLRLPGLGSSRNVSVLGDVSEMPGVVLRALRGAAGVMTLGDESPGRSNLNIYSIIY